MKKAIRIFRGSGEEVVVQLGPDRYFNAPNLIMAKDNGYSHQQGKRPYVKRPLSKKNRIGR